VVSDSSAPDPVTIALPPAKRGAASVRALEFRPSRSETFTVRVFQRFPVAGVARKHQQTHRVQTVRPQELPPTLLWVAGAPLGGRGALNRSVAFVECTGTKEAQFV